MLFLSRTFHIRIPDKTTKHDSSGEICDRFASEDSRIHVIHKQNTGVSDSRNIAIDQAKGTYLQFLDSDDWITPNATGLLVQSAQQYHCDMVISDFYRVVGDRVSHKGDIEDDCVLTREEFAEHMIENPADFYYGVLWNKLFKHSIIEEHHLRMDTVFSLMLPVTEQFRPQFSPDPRSLEKSAIRSRPKRYPVKVS